MKPLRGRNDEGEAQRRRWTFYEAIKISEPTRRIQGKNHYLFWESRATILPSPWDRFRIPGFLSHYRKSKNIFFN
jgi:hypothetical protein